MYVGNYNLVQKLVEIQNWEYGPRVRSLFGGAHCVHYHGLCVFAGVNKITALQSPGGGGNMYSSSPNIVGNNAVKKIALFLDTNIIYNQEHSFNAQDILFKWEIKTEKYHGWSSKKVQKNALNLLFK